jgi:hypothetical protein
MTFSSDGLPVPRGYRMIKVIFIAKKRRQSATEPSGHPEDMAEPAPSGGGGTASGWNHGAERNDDDAAGY